MSNKPINMSTILKLLLSTDTHRLAVLLDELEDKSSIHEREAILQEESQTGIEGAGRIEVL